MSSAGATELDSLVSAVSDVLVSRVQPPSPSSVFSALEELRLVVPPHTRDDLVQEVCDEMVGYGRLAPLLTGETTDVLVNSSGVVWWDRGFGLELAGVVFSSAHEVRQLAVRLAVSAGRRLDESQPFVDAQLADGVRLHAVLPPIAGQCTAISLRIPRRTRFSLDYWLATASAPDAQQLSQLIASNATLVISGATGSGKTTLLRALIGNMAPRRVVVLEDTSELNVSASHVVALESRLANAEGRGAVTLRQLVRQSLRMRPDSIIIGEVRGDEVIDWLLAVTSGHQGSATSVHAHSAGQALERLELLASLSGVPADFAHRLIRQSVDAVVHCERTTSGRRIAEVHILSG